MADTWEVMIATATEVCSALPGGWEPISAYLQNGYVRYVLRRRIIAPLPADQEAEERYSRVCREKTILENRMRRLSGVLQEIIEETPDDVPNYG